MIRSISFSQEEIIQSILTLHCENGKIDVDPTYSKGNFYKGKISQPKHKFDLYPKHDDVVKSCASDLPLKDGDSSTIMFDPPFLATKGKSLNKKGGNIINKRFGVFDNEKKLHSFYVKCLHEFFRILKPNGILIFKCQDKVSSGKQYFSHCFIKEEACKVGFYAKDLFVLLAKNRIVAEWQKKNQKHARKYHSYFWVFQKKKVNVAYL